MKDLWTEEQVIIVLYEYCRRPFGQFSGRKPFLIELGELIHRSPGAIVRKVGNLASFDPKMKARGVNGLGHTAKIDEIVWNKYYGNWNQLAYDAEVILANYKNLDLVDSLNIDTQNLPKGEERLAIVKQRINQDFFRQTVLSSYKQTCCISGLNNPMLLQACHIVDWTKDEAIRTNPENGLCMNPLFHKAYDENLIGISPDYVIHISDAFFGKDKSDIPLETLNYIKSLDKKELICPERFYPSKEFLERHFEEFKRAI